MNLSEAHTGEILRIGTIADPEIRSQMIRFGLYEGSEVYCLRSIKKGPVVLRNGMQETAVGRELSKHIEARRLECKRSA